MTHLSKSDIAGILNSNITRFLSELEDTFPEEEDLLMMRLVITSVPIDLIIDQFNKYVIPYKKIIAGRDEDFFLRDQNVFSKINKSGTVNHFRQLWTSKEITNETKGAIWLWFDKFIKIVEMFNNIE